MNEALLVNVVEGLGQPAEDLERLARRQGARLRQLAQVHAVLDPVHDNEVAPGLVPDVVNLDDVGVGELRESAALADEALLVHALRGRLGREDLHGDGDVEALVEAEVDVREQTRGDAPLDPRPAEHGVEKRVLILGRCHRMITWVTLDSHSPA